MLLGCNDSVELARSHLLRGHRPGIFHLFENGGRKQCGGRHGGHHLTMIPMDMFNTLGQDKSKLFKLHALSSIKEN